MPARRCPSCNIPLTREETHGRACPVCGYSLRALHDRMRESEWSLAHSPPRPSPADPGALFLSVLVWARWINLMALLFHLLVIAALVFLKTLFPGLVDPNWLRVFIGDLFCGSGLMLLLTFWLLGAEVRRQEAKGRASCEP
jgi:hypothetical protein